MFQLTACVLLLLALASNLVKGSNYSPEQVFYDQHSRTSNPFDAALAKLTQSAFARFIIGQHTLPPKIIKITERVAVKVPYAQLIPVPHNVPYPYAVPISRPFPVEVPQVIDLNRNTAIESPENIPDFPSANGGAVKMTFNDAQRESAASYDKYPNYGSEISQELLPPL